MEVLGYLLLGITLIILPSYINKQKGKNNDK